MAGPLDRIEHFVVLMLENRSFDHLLGYQRRDRPEIDGLTGQETNPDIVDDADEVSRIPVRPATSPVMPYDPNHEWEDVQYQLNPNDGMDPTMISARPLQGFIYSAKQIAATREDSYRIMEGFTPEQLPVLSALAREFAVFNYWFSSVPGPTFPNRFFVHAATSGGLSVSPAEGQILLGFSFENGTIYGRLRDAGLEWRIYHDGIPQVVALGELRDDYLFSDRFRPWRDFAKNVAAGDLADYTFIEPKYDIGNKYQGGNSMHPQDDVRDGERLVKEVYETLRRSALWEKTMLVVLCDEHGGFYDHVVPPSCIPPDDEVRFPATRPFDFDRLGLRVPALAVSAWTKAGTVIGTAPDDPDSVFDHASVLATVEKKFDLLPLTKRDSLANTLEVVLNLDRARTSPGEAPERLPEPAGDALFPDLAPLLRAAAPAAKEELSKSQETFVSLAYAIDLRAAKEPAAQAPVHERRRRVKTPKEACDYIRGVDEAVLKKKE